MSGPRHEPEPVQAQLGLWDAISVILGIVIGSGIFATPWLVFANTPNPAVGLLVWVVGGVLVVVGALCYAELATTYPRLGGDYVYLTRAFGPGVGFLFGWSQLSVILPASIGLMAFVFADYAGGLFPQYEVPVFGYAAGAVIVLTLLNLLGVVFGKTVQNLLTIVKVAGLVGVLVAGFWYSKPEAWSAVGESFQAIADRTREQRWPALEMSWGSLALILVLYTYGGWNDAAFVAAEVRNRKRNIPRALLIGVGLITLIYVLVNLAYLVCLGFDEAKRPGRIAARLMEQTGWEYGSRAISALVMVSALGALNGLIYTGSRVYSSLGADHRIFALLGRWSRWFKTPAWALLLQALISIGMILALGTPEGQHTINDALTALNLRPGATSWTPEDAFDMLVSCTAPVFWFFFLLTGFSLIRLREMDAGIERPFSVPLYPFLPLIFCNMCLYMLWAAIDYRKWFTLPAILLVLLGVPLYFLSGRKTPALAREGRPWDAPPAE
jgi:APA family basic amino acid/polyamine antiporter